MEISNDCCDSNDIDTSQTEPSDVYEAVSASCWNDLANSMNFYGNLAQQRQEQPARAVEAPQATPSTFVLPLAMLPMSDVLVGGLMFASQQAPRRSLI